MVVIPQNEIFSKILFLKFEKINDMINELFCFFCREWRPTSPAD